MPVDLEKYQNLAGWVGYYLVNAEFLIMQRKLGSSLSEVKKLISAALEQGVENQKLQGLGWQGVVQVLMGDITAAKESLSQAEHISHRQIFWPPWFISPYHLAQFMLDLHRLREAVQDGSRSSVSRYAKAALKSGKRAVRTSAKFAAHRTCNYRLMGSYYWLIGNQKKAMKWFDKSIREGERLGARPDLARTYMEVGKCLLESKSNYMELNGLSAEDYLEKAEKLFREMDLQWDLEQLERIRLEL